LACTLFLSPLSGHWQIESSVERSPIKEISRVEREIREDIVFEKLKWSRDEKTTHSSWQRRSAYMYANSTKTRTTLCFGNNKH
jgi:hypothetical protein